MKKRASRKEKRRDEDRSIIRENLVTALEVPGDIAWRDPIVTITGPTQAVIENYRSILCYTSEKLVILTKSGKITFCGRRLEIPCYTPMEMQVHGIITGIFLERQ